MASRACLAPPCRLRVGAGGTVAFFLRRARGGLARHGADTRPHQVPWRRATRARRTKQIRCMFQFYCMVAWFFWIHALGPPCPRRHARGSGRGLGDRRVVPWAWVTACGRGWALARHHLGHFVFEKDALHRALLAPGNASRMPESHPQNKPGLTVCLSKSRRVDGTGKRGGGLGIPPRSLRAFGGS